MEKRNYVAASLLAIGVNLGILPVNAQDAPAENAGAQGTASSADANARVADIIVTAQRREERNQDVPIAITAFSNERLQQQNITSGQSLNGVVPSLTVGANSQGTRDVAGFTLRGVGPKFEAASAVATYLAEVPLPEGVSTSQQGGPGNFLDLENVQVLAGPQGTLFGRNTTGGAVLLVPHRPTNEFEGYVQASYGNYDYVGLEGVVNIPVVEDKLMIRAAASYQDRDGFTRDIVWNKDRDDVHYYTGRLSVLFKPTESITNYLVVYGTKSSTNGTSYINRGWNFGLLQAFGICAEGPGPNSCDILRRQTEIQDQIGPRKVRLSVDQFDSTDIWGAINKTTIELSDAFTVNNIVSYHRFKHTFSSDGDGTPLQMADIGTTGFPDFPVPGLVEFGVAPNGFSNTAPYGPRDNLRQITEELQLQGSLLDDHLTFTAGGFYFDSKPGTQLNRAVFQCPVASTGTCEPFRNTYGVANKSKALYAQGTLDLGAATPALESLRLTAGYRYTWDTVDGFASWHQNFPFGLFCFSGFVPVPAGADPDVFCRRSANQKFRAPTWTFGVDYKPMSNLLLFAKVSRGYRQGGFSVFSTQPATQVFDPERAKTYEVGFKSDWNIGSVPLRLNASAYKTNYLLAGAGNLGIGTAALLLQSRIKGFEVDGSIRPFRALEIGGNLSYTDGHYVARVQPIPINDCRGLVPAGQPSFQDCPYGTAKWIYSIHGSLDLPVPENWGTLNLYANWSYIGKQFINVAEPLGIFDPYGLLNLSARWGKIGGSNIDAEAFVTNATNKLYRNSYSAVFFGVGTLSEVFGEPRMYGLRLRYSFGGG